MKKKTLSAIITILAIVLYSMPVNAQDRENNPLEAVYNSYFTLKDALVKSDGKSAQQAAATLSNSISAVPMEQLSPQQHEVWMKNQQALSDDAGQIKKSDNVDKQRKAFTSLSENLYGVMKVIKYGKTVYWQHCPMYNKGANWLSLDNKIMNPYYGSAMLTCGNTVEVFE